MKSRRHRAIMKANHYLMMYETSYRWIRLYGLKIEEEDKLF